MCMAEFQSSLIKTLFFFFCHSPCSPFPFRRYRSKQHSTSSAVFYTPLHPIKFLFLLLFFRLFFLIFFHLFILLFSLLFFLFFLLLFLLFLLLFLIFLLFFFLIFFLLFFLLVFFLLFFFHIFLLIFFFLLLSASFPCPPLHHLHPSIESTTSKHHSQTLRHDSQFNTPSVDSRNPSAALMSLPTYAARTWPHARSHRLNQNHADHRDTERGVGSRLWDPLIEDDPFNDDALTSLTPLRRSTQSALVTYEAIA